VTQNGSRGEEEGTTSPPPVVDPTECVKVRRGERGQGLKRRVSVEVHRTTVSEEGKKRRRHGGKRGSVRKTSSEESVGAEGSKTDKRQGEKVGGNKNRVEVFGEWNREAMEREKRPGTSETGMFPLWDWIEGPLQCARSRGEPRQ